MTKEQMARVDAMAAVHGGRVTPEIIVEDARDESSPFHDAFEWDDSEAAEKFRLSQARTLLRSYTIRVDTEDGPTVKVPAFVRDPTRESQEQGYVSTLVLRTEDENKREVMRREVERLLKDLERLRTLAVALGVLDELRGVQDAMDGVLGALKEAA